MPGEQNFAGWAFLAQGLGKPMHFYTDSCKWRRSAGCWVDPYIDGWLCARQEDQMRCLGAVALKLHWNIST